MQLAQELLVAAVELGFRFQRVKRLHVALRLFARRLLFELAFQSVEGLHVFDGSADDLFLLEARL
jgi:hypothetical protein